MKPSYLCQEPVSLAVKSSHRAWTALLGIIFLLSCQAPPPPRRSLTPQEMAIRILENNPKSNALLRKHGQIVLMIDAFADEYEARVLAARARGNVIELFTTCLSRETREYDHRDQHGYVTWTSTQATNWASRSGVVYRVPVEVLGQL